MQTHFSADQLADTEARQLINMDNRQAYAQTRRGNALLGSNLPSQVQGLIFFTTPAFEWLAAVSNASLY